MTLADLDKKFLDATDWRIACVLAFGVACWAMLFGIPYPHPDFWADFAAAARIRPAQSMLDAFWLFPVGAVFDLTSVSKALTICGIAGRIGLGLTCGGVYLCLRAFWYERLNEEMPETPTGFWNTRFASVAGALIFCLFSFMWTAAQFTSPGFALTQAGIVIFLLWQRARYSRGLFSRSAAYALCGAMAMVRPLMLLAAVGLIVCDVRTRRKKMFQEMQQEEGEALMAADQRDIMATGVSLFFGLIIGIAVCLAAVYRFSIVPDANLWGLFDVWFGDCWGKQLAEMFVSPGTIAAVTFITLSVVAMSLGQNLRMSSDGGLVLRNIFLVVLLIVCCALGLRRMTGTDERRLNAIHQYVVALAESCRGGVSWLFTDGAFDDLIRLELRDRGIETSVMSLVSLPTDAEAAAFRDYAPERLDGDMFAAGGVEVFKYWSQERPDRLKQSAWLIGSETVRKYDAKAPICVRGGVLRYVKEGTTNAVTAVEGRMERLETVVEQVALRSVSPLEHADGRINQSFRQLLRRLASLSEERRRGYEAGGDVLRARSEQDKIQHFNNLGIALGEDGEAAQKAEQVRPTANLVLTPQEGLDVALKRADYALATRFAQSVLTANPTNAHAHFAMGMASLEINGYEQAAWYLKETVRLDPGNVLAHGNLAMAYMKMGQGKKALEYAESAAKAHPESDEIKRTLAEIRKSVSE